MELLRIRKASLFNVPLRKSPRSCRTFMSHLYVWGSWASGRSPRSLRWGSSAPLRRAVEKTPFRADRWGEWRYWSPAPGRPRGSRAAVSPQRNPGWRWRAAAPPESLRALPRAGSPCWTRFPCRPRTASDSVFRSTSELQVTFCKHLRGWRTSADLDQNKFSTSTKLSKQQKWASVLAAAPELSSHQMMLISFINWCFQIRWRTIRSRNCFYWCEDHDGSSHSEQFDCRNLKLQEFSKLLICFQVRRFH